MAVHPVTSTLASTWDGPPPGSAGRRGAENDPTPATEALRERLDRLRRHIRDLNHERIDLVTEIEWLREEMRRSGLPEAECQAPKSMKISLRPGKHEPR